MQETALPDSVVHTRAAMRGEKPLEQNRSIRLIDLTGCKTSEVGGKALSSALLARLDIEVIRQAAKDQR